MKLLDKIITLLLLIVLAPAALLMTIAIIFSWDAMPAVTGSIGETFRQSVDLALLCARLALAIAAAAALVWVARFAAKAWHSYNQQRDGSHRLRTYNVRDAASGRRVKVLVNPDLMVSPALAIGGHGVHELGSYPAEIYAAHAAGRVRVAEWQARTPGDDAISSNNGSTYRMGGIGGSAKPALERPPPPALPAPRIIGAEPPPATAVPPTRSPLQLSDALAAATATAWPLGVTEEGDLATFDPLRHSHAAIVGSPGTGKTTSVGYLLAAHALRHGWHVTILDADNGAAWAPFAAHAEHVETDPANLPGQLGSIMAEFGRRMNILRDAGAADVGGLSHLRRTLIIIEEFGDLISTLDLRDKNAAGSVNAQLDTLLRRGRKVGLHVALIDQYPENWSNQLIAGTKFRAVFQLGPNQGNKVQEYDAYKLPARGAFYWQSKQYAAWHAEPALRQLLAAVPAIDPQARLLAPVHSPVHGHVHGPFMARSPEVAPPPPVVNTAHEQPMNTAPAPVTVDGWYAWVLDTYLPHHPELLQLDARGRGVGIRGLAEAMAELSRGDRTQYEDMKGAASEVAKRLRQELGFVGGDGSVWGIDEKSPRKHD